MSMNREKGPFNFCSRKVYLHLDSRFDESQLFRRIGKAQHSGFVGAKYPLLSCNSLKLARFVQYLKIVFFF